MSKYKPSVAVVLDGYGINKKYEGNAVELAKTPTIDILKNDYLYTELEASGSSVGLEEGRTSGSEVGHINIGAGKVVKQDALIINNAIKDGSFFKNEALLGACSHVKKNNGSLHYMGLMSNDDSPHSNFEHFKALVRLARDQGIENLYIHLFTDGRDSAPKSAKEHLDSWLGVLKEYKVGKVATLGGRFYAMDRTKNWPRLKIAYDCLVNGEGEKAHDPYSAIEQAYKKVKTDEYILPTVIMENGKPVSTINSNDAIVFFNLRSDRARQFTKLFVLEKSEEVVLPKPRLKNINFVAFTGFGPYINVDTAFNGHILENTLPKSIHDKRQLYITETEKFSHVTYFLNGKCSHKVNGEIRIMIPSPNVKSYAEKPEMSAGIVTDVVLRYIKEELFDFIFINFANPDMLGHTGKVKATVEGIEFVDKCLGKICKRICKAKGSLFIFSDHGNADKMRDNKGNIISYHSKNPVPFIFCNNKYKNKKLESGGKLSNIAPTILKSLDQEIPNVMDKPLI